MTEILQLEKHKCGKICPSLWLHLKRASMVGHLYYLMEKTQISLLKVGLSLYKNAQQEKNHMSRDQNPSSIGRSIVLPKRLTMKQKLSEPQGVDLLGKTWGLGVCSL